jgi:DNA polymerase-3 subunit alpha
MNYTTIKSISELGEQDVWDISLGEKDTYLNEPNFIANGIVLHNCHASGVVLSDIPLEEIAPLRTAKDTGGEVALATQFAYEDLEYLGLNKFDILAISTLTVMAETIRLIKANLNIDIDLENLPLTDQKTFELYQSGKLVGVFQCESDGMRDTCVKVKVDRFEDIMAIISLYRPGPMDSIPEYCDRKHGRKPISYFHPAIEPLVKPVLEETYGLLVYQEAIMKICEVMADMTPTEALVIIKGISKKKEEIIDKGRKGFIAGSVRKGVPENIARQYWEKFITPFALYGFNKSHAAAYGYNSYSTAFLKANYPEEFICAYLNVEVRRRKLDRVAELEREATRMGITILPRDINKCTLNYEIVRKRDDSSGIAKSEIRPPVHCKGLSQLAAENVVANRPYASLQEFAEKTDSKLVDNESINALSDARFFKTKKEKLIEEFTMMRDDLKQNRKKGRQSGNMFDD